ncbi:MAG TPA: hypothetical protein VNJ01_12735 [Bacteriovoracaceae bacterium]|nr:hypothetical protein [Bacteriovoracaceae bacterium]
MESIAQIRHMMADSKFAEAQKAIELQLTLTDSSKRYELLSLLAKALEEQNKIIPPLYIFELIDAELLADPKRSIEGHLEKISPRDQKNFFTRIQLLKIRSASLNGQMENLYKLISEFQMMLIQKHVPVVPQVIVEHSQKYFREDFHLNLQRLVLFLMTGDLAHSEKMIKALILSCVEKSSPKGTLKKYEAISDILRIPKDSQQLEIYRSFCQLHLSGVADKKDHKRLVELVIFFDEFKFQALLLNLLDRLGLGVEAQEYSRTVRSNKEYDFVYFDKYFNHLKKYFIKGALREQDPVASAPSPYVDLELEGSLKEVFEFTDSVAEEGPDETVYFNLLRHQNYTETQLIDLAVSFLQSEMPKVALFASELAATAAVTDETILRALYMQFSCLLILGEYRRALDLSFTCLERAVSEEDVKSFLYGQAEVYLRLNDKKEARSALQRVLAIDHGYRLARERLEKLNEI